MAILSKHQLPAMRGSWTSGIVDRTSGKTGMLPAVLKYAKHLSSLAVRSADRSESQADDRFLSSDCRLAAKCRSYHRIHWMEQPISTQTCSAAQVRTHKVLRSLVHRQTGRGRTAELFLGLLEESGSQHVSCSVCSCCASHSCLSEATRAAAGSGFRCSALSLPFWALYKTASQQPYTAGSSKHKQPSKSLSSCSHAASCMHSAACSQGVDRPGWCPFTSAANSAGTHRGGNVHSSSQ